MANEAYLLGSTALAAWLQTNFAPAIEGYFAEYSSIANGATDYSALAPGASVIKVPHVTLDTAVTKSTETTLAYEAGTVQTAPSISVTTVKALAYLIERASDLMHNQDTFRMFATMAAESLAREIDAALATAVKGQTTNTPITTGATDNLITWANLLTAQSTFNAQRIAIRNCVMGIAPGAFELSVADWGDKFYSAAYRDPNGQQFAATGVEGTVLGMRVYVTPDWTSGTTDECATIWHPKVLGYGRHGVKIIGPVPEPLHIGDGFTVYDVFGAAVLNAAGVLQIVND